MMFSAVSYFSISCASLVLLTNKVAFRRLEVFARRRVSRKVIKKYLNIVENNKGLGLR
jgi:hypothetical protein